MEPITLQVVFGSLNETQNVELHILFISIVVLLSLVNVYLVLKMHYSLQRRRRRFLDV
jgi:hypothetical protein